MTLSHSHQMMVVWWKTRASSNKHTLFIKCKELLKPDCCYFRWVLEFRRCSVSMAGFCTRSYFSLTMLFLVALCIIRGSCSIFFSFGVCYYCCCCCCCFLFIWHFLLPLEYFYYMHFSGDLVKEKKKNIGKCNRKTQTTSIWIAVSWHQPSTKVFIRTLEHSTTKKMQIPWNQKLVNCVVFSYFC